MRRLDSINGPIIVLVALCIAILACGGRVFTDVRVYSLKPASLHDLYDQSSDRILKEDVWVFRPDGSFDVIVWIGGELIALTGAYEGDDAGDEFLFMLDTDGEGEFDEQLVADTEDDRFMWIEWRTEDGTYIYWLAQ